MSYADGAAFLAPAPQVQMKRPAKSGDSDGSFLETLEAYGVSFEHVFGSEIRLGNVINPIVSAALANAVSQLSLDLASIVGPVMVPGENRVTCRIQAEGPVIGSSELVSDEDSRARARADGPLGYMHEEYGTRERPENDELRASIPFVTGRTVDVIIEATGPQIRIYADPDLLLSAVDAVGGFSEALYQQVAAELEAQLGGGVTAGADGVVIDANAALLPMLADVIEAQPPGGLLDSLSFLPTAQDIADMIRSGAVRIDEVVFEAATNSLVVRYSVGASE